MVSGSTSAGSNIGVINEYLNGLHDGTIYGVKNGPNNDTIYGVNNEYIGGPKRCPINGPINMSIYVTIFGVIQSGS